MSSNYPLALDTSTNLPSPLGTQSLNSPDHAAQTTTVDTAVLAIENALGTTPGTSVLKGFVAGDLATRHQGGTFQINHVGTFNNSTLGTPTVVGGTFNSISAVGTFFGTGGSIDQLNLGTPTINLARMNSMQVWDGWQTETNTWTMVGTDTVTGTVSAPYDITTVYQVGMRTRWTAGGSVQYGIITSIGAFSGGSTSFTVYSGTAYNYAAGSAITSNVYSENKVPFGFNPDPSFWQVTTSDTSARTTSSPGVGTWYEPGSLQIIVPIGKWQLSFQAAIGGDFSANNCGAYAALSTSVSSPSDTDLQGATWAYNSMVAQMYKSKFISLSTKGTYTLIISPVFASENSIYIRGDTAPTKIYAISSLL